MTKYTVVECDSEGNKIANPHIEDCGFTEQELLALSNPYGDDIVIDPSSIVQVNKGSWNFEGASCVYHPGMSLKEAELRGMGKPLPDDEQYNHPVFK